MKLYLCQAISILQDSTAVTDGSIRMVDSYGRLYAKALFTEGKVGWLEGESDPAAQLPSYYAKLLPSVWDTSVLDSSVFPALGIEVIGNGFRYGLT